MRKKIHRKIAIKNEEKTQFFFKENMSTKHQL